MKMAGFEMRFLMLMLAVAITGCGGNTSTTVDPNDTSAGQSGGQSSETMLSETAAGVAEAPDDTATPTKQQLDAIAAISAAGGAMEFDDAKLPQTIDLASDRVFADEAVVRAVLQFPELQRLRLAVSAVSPETLSELKTLTELVELMLQDADVTDDGLAEFAAAMSHLERLTTRRLSKVTNRGIESIATCRNLEVLALIEMNQLSGEALDHLQSIDGLRSLDLRNCGGLAVGDFPRLLALKRLSELKLAGSAVNDDVLATAAKMPSLAALTIEDAEITSDGLRQLADDAGIAARLRSLTVARCFNVTDETLEMLGRMPHLETLALRDVMLSGAFLNELATSAENPLPLKTLVVNDSYLGDDAIADLPKVAPHLQRLDLQRNAGVTDRSLSAFRQLSKLKEIRLHGTGVSEAKMRQLSAEISNGASHDHAPQGDTE